MTDSAEITQTTRTKHSAKGIVNLRGHTSTKTTTITHLRKILLGAVVRSEEE
jgi:endonuclease III-like uncharacterized protein